jgi:hypothetical protein
VSFEQAEALGELHLRWTGPAEGEELADAASAAGAEWDEPAVVDLREADGAAPAGAQEQEDDA